MNIQQLRKKIEEEVAVGYVTAGGPSNFYRTQALREVLEWMPVETPKRKRPDPSSLPQRVLQGTGRDERGAYEVFRLPRSKEYRIVRANGDWRRITLPEAARLTQKPVLGTEGGSAFDRMYAKLHG